MKTYNSKQYLRITLICFFIFALVLFAFLPYTDDDWDWGTQGGLGRLANGFEDYNGRYLGNTIAIILTRVPLLKALFMAFTLTAMIGLPALLAGGKSLTFTLCAGVFLLISRDIGRETIGWVSGFINYITSTALLFAIIYALKYIFLDTPTQKSARYGIAVGLLCVVTCLFMEHVTVCLVFLCTALLLWDTLRHKRLERVLVLALIGSIIGALIMFSNGAYHHIANSTDFYRRVVQPVSFMDFIVDDCYKGYYYTIYPHLFRNQSPTLLILGLLAYITLARNTVPLPRIKKIGAWTSSAIMLVFPAYLFLCQLNPTWEVALSFTYPLELAASLVYAASLFVFAACAVNDAPRRRRMTVYLLCIGALVAPLFVALPISPRNFLPTYALTVALLAELAVHALGEKGLTLLRWPLRMLAVLTCVMWLSITVRNAQGNAKRLAYVREASDAGAAETLLPRLPYENYAWGSTPGNPMTKGYFIDFYGLREDLQLTPIPYDEFYALTKE